MAKMKLKLSQPKEEVVRLAARHAAAAAAADLMLNLFLARMVQEEPSIAREVCCETDSEYLERAEERARMYCDFLVLAKHFKPDFFLRDVCRDHPEYAKDMPCALGMIERAERAVA